MIAQTAQYDSAVTITSAGEEKRRETESILTPRSQFHPEDLTQPYAQPYGDVPRQRNACHLYSAFPRNVFFSFHRFLISFFGKEPKTQTKKQTPESVLE